MSRPWMPLYIADYLQDTGHLSTAEHGAYFLLMMHYWANKGLPADDRRLARIVRMSDREWSGSKDTIATFFSDGWKHKRIEFEMTEAERISNAGRAGGKASAQARLQRTVNDTSTIVERSSNDQVNETDNDTPTKPPALQLQRDKEERKTDSRRIAVATAAVFEEFWKVYPKREGDNPKKPAAKKFLALALSGVDPPAIVASAKRYAANCDKRKDTGTRYVAQAVTWLNQERFSDYGAASDETKIVKPRHGQVLGPEFGEKASGRIFVLAETPEWDAWCSHIRSLGKITPPRHFHEGWAFTTLWPPGYEPQTEAAE